MGERRGGTRLTSEPIDDVRTVGELGVQDLDDLVQSELGVDMPREVYGPKPAPAELALDHEVADAPADKGLVWCDGWRCHGWRRSGGEDLGRRERRCSR